MSVSYKITKNRCAVKLAAHRCPNRFRMDIKKMTMGAQQL